MEQNSILVYYVKLMYLMNYRQTALRQAILQLLGSIYAHACSLWWHHL